MADETTNSPARLIPGDEPNRPLKDAIALCLSGGGYRAMMFHLGALWRLNELAYLGRLDRISSVSGGSITAAVLGLHWNDIEIAPDKPAANFGIVVDKVRKMASETIDIGSVLEGVFGPGTVSEKIQHAYDDLLFHGATLQNLPDTPRFVINATNVQSTVLWRFSKPYMRDWRVGEVREPRIPLSLAVAASSAFPPVLSPCEVDLKKYGCVFEPGSGADLQMEPYTSKAILSDGGVYDNLGLETAWKAYKTILVSDGGGHVAAEPQPHRDWARHAYRVLDIIDNQVRALRVRQVIDQYKSGQRLGAFWGIRTDIANYGLANALPCPHSRTMAIASMPTRLKKLDDAGQERLINWGYAVCDAAMRAHVETGLPAPTGFPYARGVS
jgi:NTE family protein